MPRPAVRPLLPLLALLVLLSGCGPDERAADSAPPGLSAEPLLTLDLEPWLGRLRTVTAVVGSDTARFLFDTGGGKTLVSPELARSALGCEPAGRSVGFRMSGERVDFSQCPRATFDFGPLQVVHEPAEVFDLMALLPEGLPRLDGVVSLESFADRAVTLELACGRLTVESEASLQERIRPMQPLRMRIATGPDGGEVLVFLATRGGEIPSWLLWDSGNLAGVQLAPHTARRLGAERSQPDDSLRLPLPIAGMPVDTVPARVSQLILDGALDAAWIERGVFTVDLRNERMWGRARTGEDCPAD